MDEVLNAFPAVQEREPEPESFGQYLRRHRETRQVSLEEMAWATKVKTEYLAAMEAGDFSSLPGEIFAKGYIRSYSQYLGMDTVEAVARYVACKTDGCVVPAQAEAEPKEPGSFLSFILFLAERIKRLLTGREDFQVY